MNTIPGVSEQKDLMRAHGITVHRDMMGPVDSIMGQVACAQTIKMNLSDLSQHIIESGSKNFAFYAITDSCIRFAIW